MKTYKLQVRRSKFTCYREGDGHISHLTLPCDKSFGQQSCEFQLPQTNFNDFGPEGLQGPLNPTKVSGKEVHGRRLTRIIYCHCLWSSINNYFSNVSVIVQLATPNCSRPLTAADNGVMDCGSNRLAVTTH